MDIRSVTLFDEATSPLTQHKDFLATCRHIFPFPVQTTRLATPPFPDWWRETTDPTREAQQLAGIWQVLGIDYISLGPVQLHHDSHWLDLIPTLLSATDCLFASAEVADQQGHIDIGRCHHIAGIIQQISTLPPNGFGNLYFTALAHCPAGSPFFPVAYHQGGKPQFALALESADLALTAIQQANTLNEARYNLITTIEETASQLSHTAQQLAQQFHIEFAGIDFSFAPFPTDDKSLGAAMEALGIDTIGAAGSLFTAAFITEAINRANFPRCGFSGLMLPVLEDSCLAQRTIEGKLTVNNLLSYAAVCGVGLDTIPLAGDIEQNVLAGILLDLAALATRLCKPLTARLMPLPNHQVGDPVTFDFPYFADSVVMDVAGKGVHGKLQENTRLHMHPIHSKF